MSARIESQLSSNARTASSVLPGAFLSGAENDALAGAAHRGRHGGRLRQILIRLIPTQPLRQPKIQHLHRAVVLHLHVGGLQVAVIDSLFVGSLKRLGDLRGRIRGEGCEFSS